MINDEHMPVAEEAEFRIMIDHVYKTEGIVGVLDCLLSMQKSQLVITEKLKEIVIEENGRPKSS
jgi:hypothetical protein